MDAFKFDISQLTLIAATLLTGLSAGLCFIWTNTITPGIGRLEDLGYLQAFQQMNRVILNPLFFLIFFGPVILIPLSTYLLKGAPTQVVWIVGTASLLYAIGLGLITIFGNVPLNEILDKSPLAHMSLDELKALRGQFEVRWNRLHLIRTLTSALAFLLLIITCLTASPSS